MKIEIYSKDNCSFCDKAIYKAQAMIQENDEYTYKVFKLGIDFDRDTLLKWFPSAKTFPQIKIDGQSIGGWNEFERF